MFGHSALEAAYLQWAQTMIWATQGAIVFIVAILVGLFLLVWMKKSL